MDSEKHAGGRPPIYSQEVSDKICETIATSSKSLSTICDELGLKVMTVNSWKSKGHPQYKEEFLNSYTRAKEDQADLLAEEIIKIADDVSEDLERVDEWGNRIENKEFVNRSKIRIDARKWVAAKLKPKRYGEKLEIETIETPISAEDRLKRLQALQEKLSNINNEQ